MMLHIHNPKLGLTAAVLAGLLGIVSVSASANPVTLQDGYVKAGVNDAGTLGSGETTSPGILYDSTGTGNYGINDFLTPGSPFEGFSVTGTGFGYCSNNMGASPGCASSFGAASPTAGSATEASWTGTTSDGNLTVTNKYTLTTLAGQSVIAITTTLTNNTNAALSGVKFLRTLDPDPDVNAFGTFETDNTVVSDDQACGTGPKTGETICAYSFSPYTHKAGVSEDWSRDPATYLAGVNDGNGDYAIGVGFSLGDLDIGKSITFDYGYALGASLVIATHHVPEPSDLAMFGLGLLGLLGFVAVDAKRRKAANNA